MNECMNWADFLHTYVNLRKLRTNLVISGCFWEKNVHETLISKCMNEPGRFFACYIYLRELKVALIVIGQA